MPQKKLEIANGMACLKKNTKHLFKKQKIYNPYLGTRL